MEDLLLASLPKPPFTSAHPPLVSDAATLPEAQPLLECVTAALGVAVAWIDFSDGTRPCYVATADPVALAGLLSDETLLALARDSEELVVVDDAAQDPRLFASPWVTGPIGIRFFASAPILLGHQPERTGTLCVADRTARLLDASQAHKLVALAAIVAKIIEGSQAVQHGNTLQLELRRTKTLLERTGAMAGVGGWEVDLVANTIFWSDETCRIHGVAPGYLPQLSEAIEFYAPQARPVIEAAVTQSIATGQRWDLELPFIQKNGTEIWVRALGVAEFKQGKPVRLVGAFQDITARRLAEAALVISESQFRGSFEAASHGIALVSVHGRFLKVNQSLCKLLGYGEAELLVTDFQTITHPDDLALDLHHVEELLQGVVETYEMEKRYFHKDGRTIWAQLNVSLVRTRDGAPVHFVSQIQDITDRKNLTARLQTLLDTASDGIHILDRDGNVLQFSQSFTLLLGYTAEETARLNVRDWDAMFEPQELIAEIGRLIAQPRAFETRYRRKDGIILDVEINAKGVVLDGVDLLYASARDITARKQAEWALEQGRLLTKDILDSVSSEIVVLNESGVIMATNEAWRRFAADNGGCLDSPSSDNVDVGANYLAALSTLPPEPADSVNIREGIEAVINGKLPKFSCEYPCHTPEKQRWFVMKVTPMHTGDRGAVIVHVDITDRKEAETLMYDYAFHDSLTKLANRRLLKERLNMTIASNKRSGTYGALLVIDLDNFKPLNDQFGHAVGDLLLKEVANRLKDSVRQDDTVARIGGDEFVIALGGLSESQTDSRQLAVQIAEKVRNRLSEIYNFTVHQGLGEVAISHRCSASIGVALFSPTGSDQMELFRQADAAMYLAKESGRNAVRFEDE
ncbi:PAS domain S-box protein [Glaciimonas sp. Gout2]|uniref:PAS domain S-box protein n=1 Tax=unclassified Glaciimonas TaxID=2644401 RepID=UPI002B22764F|nr:MULTISPECIES: PAS domain S-box protein [unclassified Glaciimonas]MEB0083169.1 PAS domain S-box protein [Glaciimonas sp. Gout2]